MWERFSKLFFLIVLVCFFVVLLYLVFERRPVMTDLNPARVRDPGAGAHGQGEAMTRKPRLQPSLIQKRSVRIRKHKTSVSVEEEFWEGLKEIARERSLSLNALLSEIEGGRAHTNLSSDIRLFVLDHYITVAKQKTK